MTSQRHGIRVDRRTTIKWLAAAMAAAYSGCSRDEKYLGDEIPSATGEALGIAKLPDGLAYGGDPDLMHPQVPWSRTMTDAQLRLSAALCDMILPEDNGSPAASAVGVPDFIDEWVSAPYPDQQKDREILLPGLEWLEQRSLRKFGSGFADATEAQKSALLDELAATPADRIDPADNAPPEFFRRFRYLTVGAFYTTPEGMADVGYIGNVPIAGKYPGPSAEALAHLAGVLKELGLPMPD